jgi:hypothetical protein
MNKIVHCKKSKYDFYVGRPSKWGNPFSYIGGTQAEIVLENREESIEAYRQWLAGEAFQDLLPEKRQWILDNVYRLKGKILGCWCYPKKCHAEILIDLANGKSIKTEEKKPSIEINKLF